MFPQYQIRSAPAAAAATLNTSSQYSLQCARPNSRQSPALTSPLPDFAPPHGARGQDVMIIWDMQNTRIPTELEPTDVIRFLYNTFVMQPGPRRCAGAFCTFTDNTKKAVGERRFNQFCSNGVLNFMMINSPGGPRKADDSDHPLKEMMMNFTVDCVRGHKDGVVVLITADADFVRPALWCKQQGCVSLELLYYDPIASKEIRQLEASWKMEWRDFLDCSVGRRCAWTFPYPQDVAAGLPPGTLAATGGYYSSTSPGSSSSSSLYDGRERQQHALYPSNNSTGGGSHQHHSHHQQQQMPYNVAGFLPGPPQRRMLPAPGSTSSSGSGSTAATGSGSSIVQVTNTHVQQAAQQLLHNPAALHQVVQQYKQSMQTTAVLQQLLQGVAHAGAGPAAAGAAAAAAPAAAAGRAAFPGSQVLQQQKLPERGGDSSNSNTPVKLFTRSMSGTAMAAPAGNSTIVTLSPPAASSTNSSTTGNLTWQQLEQQQNGGGSSTARGGSGFWDVPSSTSSSAGHTRSSPPPPDWWDATSSSSGKSSGSRKNSRSSMDNAAAAAGATAAATPSTAAGDGKMSWGNVGSSSSKHKDKVLKFKPEGWSQEEDNETFWDAINSGSASAGVEGGSAHTTPPASRSHTPNKNAGFSTLFSGSGNGLADLVGSAAASTSTNGSSAVVPAAAAAATSAGLPPPLPSMGLLKRAGGAAAAAPSAVATAGGGNSGINGTGSNSGSSNLASLLANAAAKAGSSSGGVSPGRAHVEPQHSSVTAGVLGQQQLQQQQHHQRSSSGGFGMPQLQQTTDVNVLPSAGSGNRQQQQHHQQPPPPRPPQQQQQQQSVYDRHMQHHEQQLMLLQKQQQARDAVAAAGSSSWGTSGTSSLNGSSREAAAADDQQEAADFAQDLSSGVMSRPKRLTGPELTAAARILTRATAEAVADTAMAAAVPVDLLPAASSGNTAADCHGSGSGVQAGVVGRAAVVVLQAPPVPVHKLPVGTAADSVRKQEAAAAGKDVEVAADQQQQPPALDYLIDEETGELIFLKPSPSAAVAAVTVASAAAAAAASPANGVLPAVESVVAAAEEEDIDGSVPPSAVDSDLQETVVVAAPDAASSKHRHESVQDWPAATAPSAAGRCCREDHAGAVAGAGAAAPVVVLSAPPVPAVTVAAAAPAGAEVLSSHPCVLGSEDSCYSDVAAAAGQDLQQQEQQQQQQYVSVKVTADLELQHPHQEPDTLAEVLAAAAAAPIAGSAGVGGGDVIQQQHSRGSFVSDNAEHDESTCSAMAAAGTMDGTGSGKDASGASVDAGGCALAAAGDSGNVDVAGDDGEVDVDAAVAAAIAAAALAARPDDFLSELQTPVVEPLQNPETYLHGFPPSIATSQGLRCDEGGFVPPLMCNDGDSAFGSCSCSSSESTPIAFEDLNLSGERVLPPAPLHLMMAVSPTAAPALSAPVILDQLDFAGIKARMAAGGPAGMDNNGSSAAAAAMYDTPGPGGGAEPSALDSEPVQGDVHLLMRHAAGSPVTAIEELGNVSTEGAGSGSSSGSSCDGDGGSIGEAESSSPAAGDTQQQEAKEGEER